MRKLIAERLPSGKAHELNEVTGRCHKCNIRFIWRKRLGKLSEMICPFCYNHLEQTTHMFKGETLYLREDGE